MTSIVKGSRSKRRRSEVAVAQRKQSVACDDDDEELARELAEEEEEGDDDASDAGYERDGFVVGDNDVEFYESAEEADAAPLPPRRARAANPAPAPARGGRLRRHARATPDPDSQTSVDEPRPPAAEDDEDEGEGAAPRLEPAEDAAPPLEDVEDSPPLCDDESDDARPPPKRVALRESPPWLPRRTYGTPAPLITQSSARSSSCSGHITSPESDDGDARPVRGGGPASLFDRFRYVEASE